MMTLAAKLKQAVVFSVAFFAVPVAHAAPVPKDDEGKKKVVEAAWADFASADDQVADRARLVLKEHATVQFFADKLKPLTLTEKRAKELIADLGSEKEPTWKAAFEELSYLDPRLVLRADDIMGESTGQVHDERLAAVLNNRLLADAESFRWLRITVRVSPAPPRPGAPVSVFMELINHPGKPAEFQTSLDKANVKGGAVKPIPRDASTLSAGQNQSSSWRRAVRATALLEDLGKPEARMVLEDMATGLADASPTVAAKAALGRLKK